MKKLLILLPALLLTFAAPAQNVIYYFTNDPAQPYDGVTLGYDGNLYGTTEKGGTYNDGVLFRLATNGVVTTLYSFTGGSDGANPYAGLTLGADGYFYGTCYGGGKGASVGFGTVYKATTNGIVTGIYSFAGGTGGEYPQGGVVLGPDGFLYGTTYQGGSGNYGTVFQLSTNGILEWVTRLTAAIG